MMRAGLSKVQSWLASYGLHTRPTLRPESSSHTKARSIQQTRSNSQPSTESRSSPNCTPTSNQPNPARPARPSPPRSRARLPWELRPDCRPRRLGSAGPGFSPTMAPPPGPLIKFPLHPASNIGQPSFVGSFLASHPPPIGLADLHALRAILETAQSQARDRLIFKDANKDNVASRQANQKRQVEAQAELVNAERKRKLAREEEDRRERDKEREREKDRDKEEEHTRQIKKEDHQLAIQLDDQSLDSEDDHANLPLAQAAKTKHHPPTTSRDLKPTIQSEHFVSKKLTLARFHWC